MSFNTEGDGELVAIADEDTYIYMTTDDGPSSVELEGVKMTPVPRCLASDEKRNVYYVSGQPGSGKTVFTSQLLNKYRKAGYKKFFVFTNRPSEEYGKVEYPDIKELVGLSTEYDDAMRDYEKKKIRFRHKKKELKDEPEMLMKLEMLLIESKPNKVLSGKIEFKIDPDEFFRESVVVMDDYLDSAGDDVRFLTFMRDHLLTVGRHTGTSMILCHHVTSNGTSTKQVLANATDLVVFRRSTPQSRRYVWKTYMGLSNRSIDETEERLKAGDRWACINRDLGYIMTPTFVTVV